MIRSNVCDYSDAYIHVKLSITIPKAAATAAAPVNNTNKKVIFKNCAPFTSYIREIDNTQLYSAQNIEIVYAYV